MKTIKHRPQRILIRLLLRTQQHLNIRQVMERGEPQPKYICTVTITGVESFEMASSEAAGSVRETSPDP